MDDFDNGSQDSGSGINPAWNEVLELIPEDSRDSVIPHLQKWDNNFQSQVQKVHSDYEPYKDFRESQISADDLRMGLGILNAIQDNPEEVWKSLGNSYGFADDAGQGSSEQGSLNQNNGVDAGNSNFGLPPEVQQQLQQLQQGHDAMAQIILQKQQQEDEARRDAALKDELGALKQKHGEFDNQFVLTHMMNGASGEDAVAAYQQLVEKIMTESNRPKAPRLLGTGNGGGVPGNNRPDVTKMDPSQTKNYVVDYLRSVAEQNR